MARVEQRQDPAPQTLRSEERPAPERDAPPSAAVLLGHGEVLLDGRRYRLVPLETPAAQAASLLTARELQIAALVAEGRVNKQIAAELQISEWTVSTHLRRIFAKLGVDTRAAMVSRCMAALAR